MPRQRHLLAFLGALVVFAPAAARAAPNDPPASSGANGGGAPRTRGVVAGTGKSADFEELRRGIVQIEQSGRPMAIGTVLSKDGRVLTSLSGLGTIEQLDIRYADNTVVKAKIGHADKAWDLALLVPQSGRWLDGLTPTDADPAGLDIKAFLPKGGKLAAATVSLQGRAEARTKEGDPLQNVLDLDLKGMPAVPGAPVLAPDGKVVGVLVRACKAARVERSSDEAGGESARGVGAKHVSACAPITIGAPVSALKSFLMKTPSSAVRPAPWLGLGGAPADAGNVKGIRVMGVAPGSPAERAGLNAAAADADADTIVAVDGVPVETPEQLAEVIAKCAIGQAVKLLVYRHGKFREAAATLRRAPP